MYSDEEEVDARTVDSSGDEPVAGNLSGNETGDAREAASTSSTGLDLRSAPIVEVADMFVDMVAKVAAGDHGHLLNASQPVSLNVATLCSGTDAPVFALHLVEKASLALGFGSSVVLDHLYSCEIEPYKQAFLRRNVSSSAIIFRDVVEMAQHIGTDRMA
jgi:hypothetical protein